MEHSCGDTITSDVCAGVVSGAVRWLWRWLWRTDGQHQGPLCPPSELPWGQGEETQFTFGEALACVCAGSDAEGREEFSVNQATVRHCHPSPGGRRLRLID